MVYRLSKGGLEEFIAPFFPPSSACWSGFVTRECVKWVRKNEIEFERLYFLIELNMKRWRRERREGKSDDDLNSSENHFSNDGNVGKDQAEKRCDDAEKRRLVISCNIYKFFYFAAFAELLESFSCALCVYIFTF